MIKTSDGVSLAEKLFKEAFAESRCRDPRSDEYKAGVRAALRFRLAGEPIPHPYRAGTAQDDAYYAGIGEGHMIFRNYEQETKDGK
jgi:hypothetical protein